MSCSAFMNYETDRYMACHIIENDSCEHLVKPLKYTFLGTFFNLIIVLVANNYLFIEHPFLILGIKHFSKKSFSEQGCQTDWNITLVEQNVLKLEEANRDLTTKCTELEDCIELLKNEYEKCEDYWQVVFC